MRLTSIPLALCGLAAVASAQTVQMKSISTYAAGTAPRASALADVDADGDLDLVVTAESPAQVVVLVNAGGAFTTGQSVPLGLPADVGRVVAADLDGDGDVDLAVTHRGGALVLLENVAGAFTIRATIALSQRPDDLVAGDFEGDGDVDLAVAGEDGLVLWELWNQGGFGFQTFGTRIPKGATALAVGHVTGLGRLDVVAVNADTDEATVFWPAYLGVYALVQLPRVALDNVHARDVVVGDLDGNGFDDVTAVGYTSQGINLGRGQVLLASGGGGLQKLTAFVPHLGPTHAGALADFDLDGDLDLALGGILGDVVAIHPGLGTGDFAPLADYFPTDFGGVDLEAADLDGDGAPDVVELVPASGTAWVLLNAAVGTPATVASYCTAKVNSQGVTPAIGASGLPSLGAQGFGVTLKGGVPSSFGYGIAMTSAVGPAATPFRGGLLCVQLPIERRLFTYLTASGDGFASVPVEATMVGATRWYQWYFRDTAHPDGTGAGLSDALAVTFGP